MPKENSQGSPCPNNTSTTVTRNSSQPKVKDVPRNAPTSSSFQLPQQLVKSYKLQPGSFDIPRTSSRAASSNLCKCGDKCILCGQIQSIFAVPNDHCTEVLDDMLQCYGLSIATCTSNDLMGLLREQIEKLEKADRDIRCCKTFTNFMSPPKTKYKPDTPHKTSQAKTWEGLLQEYKDLKLDPPPESTDVAKSFRHKFLVESSRVKKCAKRRIPKAPKPGSEMRQNEYVNSTLLKFTDWMIASQDKLELANSIRSHDIEVASITQLAQIDLSMETILNARKKDGQVPDEKAIVEVLEGITIDKINLMNKFDSTLGEFVGVAGERSQIICSMYENDKEKGGLKSMDCQTDPLSDDEDGKFIDLDPSFPLVERTHTMLKTYGGGLSATLVCEGLDFIPKAFTNASKQ